MLSQWVSTHDWRTRFLGVFLYLTMIAASAQDAGPAAAANGEAVAEPAGAEGPAAPAGIPAATGSFTTRVDGYTIENRGPWMRGERIKGRLPELWASYMHGIVDFFATVVPWQRQFLPRQNVSGMLDADTTLQGNPYRRSPLPTLRLEAGEEVVTGVPILAGEDFARLAGETIRVFVWMRGQATGETGHLWASAPRMDVLVIDSGGYSVVQHRGPMATRGTFPWHCYVSDIVLPAAPIAVAEVGALRLGDNIERERGVYLRFSNPGSGTVWFSTLSWETVDETSTYTLGQKQDPVTGSMAPNARYDELPLHLSSPKVMHRGMVPAYEWAFLAGAKRGAVNVPDILSRSGFDDYLEESAMQDSHHFLNGVTRLAAWYHAGMRFKTLPPAEGGWLEYVGTRMVALQNAEKGFWGIESQPLSMGLTAAVLQRLFGYHTIPRADREPVTQPWLSCGIENVPKPAAIAKTVLAMQVQQEDAEGGPGAWSTVAYHYAAPEELAFDSSCDLATTADAVYLLRRCMPNLGPDLQKEAQAAVRRAMERVWETCLLPTGLWKQNSDDSRATHGAFMGRLVDASPILEYRIEETLPAPKVAEVPLVEDGGIEIDWLNPTDEAVSLRIYAAPKAVAADQLSDANLIGIIQLSDGDARTLDPLVLLQLMRVAANDAWGMSWFAGYGGYTDWKVGLLPDPLVTSVDGEPVTVTLKEPGKMNIFVASANWYGETSVPAKVPFKVSAVAAEQGVFDEDGDADVKEGEGNAEEGADGADTEEGPAPW